MSGILFPVPRVGITPANGLQAFFYVPGSTTKRDTYTTSALNIANNNPVVADGNGLFPAIYIDPALSYKVVIAPMADTDPPSTPILTQDNAYLPQGETRGSLPAPTTRAGTVVVYPPALAGGDGVVYSPTGDLVDTTGTTTSGLQEAIDYASGNGYDLHIEGGDEGAAGDEGAVVYFVDAGVTLAFPAMQGKRITSGAITINGNGTGTEPVISFDSMMMTDIDLSGAQIVGVSRTGHVITFVPTHEVPLDAVMSIIDSRVHITTVVGKVASPTAATSVIYFDTTNGSITHSTFSFEELNGNDSAIQVGVPASGKAFEANIVTCRHVHGQGGTNPHVWVGISSSAENNSIRDNIWNLAIAGIGTKRGYDTRETAGHINLACNSVSASAYDVYFEDQARRNTVWLSTDSANPAFDDDSDLLNVVHVQTTPSVAAVTVGSSPFVYPASTDGATLPRQTTVTVTDGIVSAIDIGDGSTWASTGVTTGTFRRVPGMYLKVTFSGLPTMKHIL